MTNLLVPERRVQKDGNLAWLDLEMTGLDPAKDVILQAALVVTDAQLTPIEEFVVDVWAPEGALARMVPFVRDMHTKSGLLERVARSKVDVGAAERQLLERITGHIPYPAVLCGNSIGQDKRFVERHMPGLAGYLSYRTIDVSSIKILAKLWYGGGAVFDKPKDREHDALFDVQNSIAELAHYRKTLFR
jgi:oligoribonuclease